MGTFGLLIRREARGRALLGAVILGTFVLSPFLLNLRATSLVETLYPPILGASLLMAGLIQNANTDKRTLCFTFACATGLSVFVKPDGIIIPFAPSPDPKGGPCASV